MRILNDFRSVHRFTSKTSLKQNNAFHLVFFTRNGKTVGQREVSIPRGGFFPTVGMLSSDEKVRADLRPLTG
ncbi:hypothetical protein LSH36_729g02064 [Paralvinella palmiformis]|uniref:Uncharacterized protein n=1 Tax=Paralvinella palmiformis TaxID=53620 RepID=A0AAD9J1E0_9ANNE|nr:hypothetical protein LSH36_729g02064 [Paralvinella palmiformis]